MVRFTITLFVIGLLFLAGCQQGVLPKGCPQPLPADAGATPVDVAEEPEEVTLAPVEEATQGSSDPLAVARLAGFEVDDGIPTKVVKAGETVSFPNLRAQDPEGDPVDFSFSFPLGADGTWETQSGDEGEYFVRISASDGVNEVSERVRIVVLVSNHAPRLEVANLVDVNEGEAFDLDVSVSDADDDDVTVSFSGWVDTLPYTTTFADAGEHIVTVTATDGQETVSEDVTVIVSDVNRAPRITQIPDVLVTAGQTVALRPKASDPDGDDLTFTFSSPIDEQGLWETTETDVGSHRVTITASDGTLEDSTQFFVVVEGENEAPVIVSFEDVVVEEGDVVVLRSELLDPEDDDLLVTYTGWMTSDTRVTTFDDEGVHEVTLTVSDGQSATSETITVTVLDVNRPPIFGDGSFS